MEAGKKKIMDYVDKNKDRIVRFLCDFISKKSISRGTPGTGEESEAQEWLGGQLKELGFADIDVWYPDKNQRRPNVVAKVKGSGKGRSIIFQGHVDVVPVPDSEATVWNTDPWKGTVRDGKVYGRGSSDTKAGITGMVWAAKAVMDCGGGRGGDIILASTIGEESQEGETIGAAGAVKRGYTAPFAVVAEPTNCEIHTESAGIFLFDLTVFGKSVHTASRNQVIFPQRYGIPVGPTVGVDAITKMKMFMDLFERLEIQWNQRWRNPILGGGGYPVPGDKQGVGLFTINPSFIEGGVYLGSVPSRCKLTCCVWYPSWVKVDEVIAELRDRVEALSRTDDWLREHPPEFKAPVLQNWRPFRVPVDHEGVKTLASSYEEVEGRKAIHSGFRATCDATWLNELGVPSITFGPGGLEMGVHGPNEYVPIDELMSCTKVYAMTALNWCG